MNNNNSYYQGNRERLLEQANTNTIKKVVKNNLK